MGAGRGDRRSTAAAVLALAALAVSLAGAQALDRIGFEVVAAGSLSAVLAGQEGLSDYGATLVTTQPALRALEAGLVDGDRLPADRPLLLAVRVLQGGAGSWCTSASAEVATAPDGTISVTVSKPWWRRLPTLECTQDVPAPSGLIVALDEQDLAAAPAVEVTGSIVTPAPPLDIIRCTRRGGPGDSGWVCLDELR